MTLMRMGLTFGAVPFALHGFVFPWVDLHPHSADTRPISRVSNNAVSFDKDFIGRDALLKQKLEKPDKVLVGFELMDRGVAREHNQVLYQGEVIGEVTSGMFAPSVEKFLGMAFVPFNLRKIGTEIDILVHGKPRKAKIVKRPFYIPAYRR